MSIVPKVIEEILEAVGEQVDVIEKKKRPLEQELMKGLSDLAGFPGVPNMSLPCRRLLKDL